MDKYDVTALGEVLIDFTMNGKSEQGNPLFEANPGGAPCNVLAMLCKLGRRTAFIGKVGADQFGDQLRATLNEAGIGTAGLVSDPEVHTTLAFVHTAPDGDRSFSFYRRPGADMMLEESEVPEELIANSRIFHYGSLSMTDEGVRRATERAVGIAERYGVLRSFDPNLRPPLWRDLGEARERITYGIEHCDILKISDDEVMFMTGCDDIDRAVRLFREKYSVPLMLITMGKKGSMAFTRKFAVKREGLRREDTVDTTGAGDTFCGCVLDFVLEKGIDPAEEELDGMLAFANAAAALVTTRRGAIRSMPDKEEVLELCGGRR